MSTHFKTALNNKSRSQRKNKILSENYYKNPVHCIYCGAVMLYEQRHAKTCAKKECRRKQYAYTIQLKMQKRIAKYNENPKLCIICQAPISYKNKIRGKNTCMSETCHKELLIINRKKLVEKRKKKYLENPNYCKYCNSILPYTKRRGKFCCLSCAISCANSENPKFLGIKHSEKSIKARSHPHKKISKK